MAVATKNPATKKRFRSPRNPDYGRYVNILFEEEMLKEIDDFRYKNRMPTRTDAIRWLITWSLKQKPRAEG